MILRAFQARPNSPPALCRREGNLELRWAILIIFLIGLLVVTGVFKMIF
ncbi:hypothetical protein B4W97_003532 [Salmonella enterica subsp. enterica serovar Ohio]|uniref:Uncharacterized protein n=1 Tax=Salmonella enterica TaxID=28901 RepID=A0A746ANU2_SALER|nr:hypothetical protein [Salmonella enterica subsp. enterica serovar Livingstone]EDN4785872.1 hypothetical protein [Salmonella enterica subsp. enterica]EDN4994710.1 hypothetical protein [Salmonella enterica subsp. enterica serovar Ohio]EDN6859499.1 hypothetical protein [Salmonella enterica]EDR0645326.1 hypothetical protein [Salmonella enterica subsp. enterica serovar Havana]EDS3305301.1 hypothetical protein [Salmonella enterica subsp. enterica serovar Umbadah]EDT1994310.1 hypothetical protein